MLRPFALQRALPAALSGSATHQHAAQPSRWLGAALAASISTTRVLEKRRGGNSAFVVKSSKFGGRKPGMRKKDKLKADTGPHKTHLDRMRELKSLDQANSRNERLWNELEQDESFNRELDAVYDYLKNLGPEGDYVYRATRVSRIWMRRMCWPSSTRWRCRTPPCWLRSRSASAR
ncbi:hypothetical protein PINS_up023391 [Pythium insidiosum]|nr:hypothetical protein PINS_up023391 [Pythium insidiosum]